MLASAFLTVLQAAQEAKPEKLTVTIPGSTVSIEFVPIPAGKLEVGDPAKPDEKKAVELKAFALSATEVPWEAFDIFVYGLNGEGPPADKSEADAKARPTKPYINMDRGWGHSGNPALSMSYKSANAFCSWMSKQTGRKIRLATEDEWEYACRAGTTTKWYFGDDPAGLDAAAWFKANSENRPHPVAKKAPNAWGLYDMLGNVCEWVSGRDGKPVVKGGAFKDKPDELVPENRSEEKRGWNATDPQVPKSTWWLSDATFVGFRLVLEQQEGAQ